MTLKIIYEDENILVIDKPPNLVVTPNKTQKKPTIVDFLREHYDTLVYHSKEAQDRMGVVHRLDKDTSGLLLVAKNQKVLENLQNQFKARQVKKEYLALVHGWMEKGGVVDAAIDRNPGNREKFAVLLDGKEAVTEYEPVKRLAFSEKRIVEIFHDLNKIQLRKLYAIRYLNYTLLVARPKTGRTHQIRVHLKYIGYPVVCDEKYAGRKMVRLDKRWCPRMFLHAKKLGFFHPVSGKWLEVESPLPEDLKKALLSLRGV